MRSATESLKAYRARLKAQGKVRDAEIVSRCIALQSRRCQIKPKAEQFERLTAFFAGLVR
jgi:hypothetical protein